MQLSSAEGAKGYHAADRPSVHDLDLVSADAPHEGPELGHAVGIVGPHVDQLPHEILPAPEGADQVPGDVGRAR